MCLIFTVVQDDIPGMWVSEVFGLVSSEDGFVWILVPSALLSLIGQLGVGI